MGGFGLVTYCAGVWIADPHGLDQLTEHLDLPLLFRERVPHIQHFLQHKGPTPTMTPN
jgi:hypothetical protein